jgi:phosphatidylserine/phosphatidylglycerophosphate/cardiolipin synthase-like enzyme
VTSPPKAARRWLAVATALTLSLTMLGVAAPSFGGVGTGSSDQFVVRAAAASYPNPYALFNNPAFLDKHGSDRYLQDGMIADATVGSTVQMSAYRLIDAQMATYLVQAAQRGVHVQVLLDGGDPSQHCAGAGCQNTAFQQLETLNTINATDPLTWLRTCSGIGPGHSTATGTGAGCIGQSLNHNKFLIASRTWLWLGWRSIVEQSSSNDTSVADDVGFNNSLSFMDQPQVTADYQRYFNKLAAAYASTTPTARMRFTPKTGDTVDTATIATHDIASWSFPQSIANDPELGILSDINVRNGCRNNVGDQTGPKRTQVRLAMFHLSAPPNLIRSLVALRRAGCGVHVVYAQISPTNLRQLSAAHASLERLCLTPASNAGRITEFVHSKYLLVTGSDASLGHNRRITYTGSVNWTRANLTTADNRLVRYVETSKKSPVYDDYLHNFRVMQRAARTAPVTAARCAATDA